MPLFKIFRSAETAKKWVLLVSRSLSCQVQCIVFIHGHTFRRCLQRRNICWKVPFELTQKQRIEHHFYNNLLYSNTAVMIPWYSSELWVLCQLTLILILRNIYTIEHTIKMICCLSWGSYHLPVSGDHYIMVRKIHFVNEEIKKIKIICLTETIAF